MSAGRRNKGNNYTTRNKVKLLRGGKPYFDCLLELIAAARDTIHLQTYIYEDDETGRRIGEALKEAVKRNVKIFVLADAYASNAISHSFVTGLRTAGIHFRFFAPLFKNRYFYFGRRLHHKVIVVDTTYAIVGGINITNRYNDMPGKPAWLDFALYIEGEAARELCVLCWKTWNNYPPHMGTTPCEQAKPVLDLQSMENCPVSMQRNDWVRRKNEISTTYINMIRKSQSHITILCSYFLPGKVIRRTLAEAAKRGVRIRVITTGISDVTLAKYAERYMYNWILKNNIELYEYQPTILHGKIAVCDSEWLTIGSYNLNNISAYASIELNMNVRNAAFAKGAEEILEDIISKDCLRITKEYYRQTSNPFKQFVRWTSHEFIRAAFYLFTFYFKHKN